MKQWQWQCWLCGAVKSCESMALALAWWQMHYATQHAEKPGR